MGLLLMDRSHGGLSSWKIVSQCIMKIDVNGILSLGTHTRTHTEREKRGRGWERQRGRLCVYVCVFGGGRERVSEQVSVCV